ncbi:hypothetical protein WG902_02885 [Ramlibacter sp. PS3R-8]|uniref:hypothetical protein n=1 Tax=Ramlibacter sp. PS3R-8 TaxID=3133437 RepID=UPI0030AE747F
MRTRSIVLIVAILLVAAFAALNWGEMVNPTDLSFGLFVTKAPLGLILLGLLAITLVLFLASTAAMRTQSLIESRQHHKTLEAQRDLADKAEASRFVDLRQHMDTQLRELRERDAISAAEAEKARMEAQREIRTQLEQINRTLSARLNEMESRLDGRPGGIALPVTTVRTAPVNEHPHAQEAHDTQMRDAARLRDEERLRDERLRQSNPVRSDERTTAADRPAETGWRRWF